MPSFHNQFQQVEEQKKCDWFLGSLDTLPGADPGFLVGGGAKSPGGGRQHTNLPDFPKNYTKLRKFCPWRPPLDPPLTTDC